MGLQRRRMRQERLTSATGTCADSLRYPTHQPSFQTGETHILWIKAWVDGCTQRGVGSLLVSKSRAVKSGISQGSVLGPALLNTFVTAWESEIENTFSKFANNTELGGAGRIAVHRELESLERWCGANLMKFHKAKCEALYMVLDGECDWEQL